MLYIERFPATPNNLFSVTVTRTALLSFGGAMGGALLGLLDRNTTELPKYFLIFQDAPVLVLLGLFLVASGRLARKQMALVAPAWIERGNGFGAAGITAIIVTGTVYAGSRLIYQNFALSLDEFMAEFDAQIIATGRLLAAAPPNGENTYRHYSRYSAWACRKMPIGFHPICLFADECGAQGCNFHIRRSGFAGRGSRGGLDRCAVWRGATTLA
jgi:hypothetical protein